MQLPPILSVEPSDFQSAISAFRTAASQVRALIAEGNAALRVVPWMGDPVSIELAADLTRNHTEGPGSILGVLDAYRAELEKVVDTLTVMQQNYEHAEADSAQRLRRSG